MTKTLNEYSAFVRDLSLYPKDIVLFTPDNPNTGGRLSWVYPVLGLQGEAGEVAEKAKKFIRDGGDKDKFREDMKKELGDVLWYVQAICNELDLELVDVFAANMEKLASRRDRGVLQGSGDNR